MARTQSSTDPLFEGNGAKDPLSILKQIYGYSAFRGKQAAVVDRLVSGGDAVVLFPTGAGKSLCFQIPALCRDGVGIVVSPLIALMRDQVEALKQLGVRAAALNSSLSREEFADVRRAIAAGDLDLLYVTPERVVTAGFRELIGNAQIALFAIDEAHCFPVFTVLGSKTEGISNPLTLQPYRLDGVDFIGRASISRASAD